MLFWTVLQNREDFFACCSSHGHSPLTRLATNYQPEVGGMTLFSDIYTKAMDFFVPLQFTPSKMILARTITSLFPESKRTYVYKKRIEYTCYNGLAERCKISTDDTPVLIPSECKADQDSLGHLMITCPTLHVVNGKIVTCTMHFGKTLCLTIRGASLHIQQQIDLTQSNVDGLVHLCKTLKLCKGRKCDENYQASKNVVKEYWSRLCNKNKIDQRVRSEVCKIVVPWTRQELCKACRSNVRCQEKKKADDDHTYIVPDMETSEDNVTISVETPSVKLEPNGMVTEAPEVMLTANADTEIDKLLKIVALSGVPERFNSLLESQLRNNDKEKDPRHRRWNKDIINLSLSLYSRSPSTYQHLKSSGFLTLPSKRLLFYYKSSVKQKKKKKC